MVSPGSEWANVAYTGNKIRPVLKQKKNVSFLIAFISYVDKIKYI